MKINKKYIAIGLSAILISGLFVSCSLKGENVEKNKDNFIVKDEIIDEGKLPEGFFLVEENIKGTIIDGNDTKSTPVKKFETKEINGITYEKHFGYWLPPEPDEQLNNSTLLGIDVNNNKVRDDIERNIVLTKGWNASLKGIKLQEARTYYLAMENPEAYKHSSDLLIKLYTLEMYYQGKREFGFSTGENTEDKDNLAEMFNTKERKIARGKVENFNGVYDNVIQNHRFVNRYRDFKIDSKDSLEGYEWSMEQYENKPFPIYSESGKVQGYYSNGRVEYLSDLDSCKINLGTSDMNTCYQRAKEFIELKKKYTIDQLIEQGVLSE